MTDAFDGGRIARARLRAACSAVLLLAACSAGEVGSPQPVGAAADSPSAAGRDSRMQPQSAAGGSPTDSPKAAMSGGPSAASDPGAAGDDLGSDCAEPAVVALFSGGGDSGPIVEQRPDGVIVTRGAGRVRGRHELEETFSPFGPLYFENRSYGFVIEDSVAAGESKIVFTYRPEAPVSTYGAQTNFRYFKIYGDGNVFHSNVTMERVSLQELTYTVERNAREDRPLAAGDLLEFEFGVFIAGNDAGDPGAIEGRTAYYSDTFRYRVGIGGLTPRSADTSGTLGPDDGASLAGDTTIPWIYAEPELYFSQMALDMQPEHVQPFLRGRRLFHTDFASGEHSEPGNPVFAEQAGKLGPLSSANACVDCHERDGRGRPPDVGGELRSMAVKLYGPAELGNQLQLQEGRARLARYEAHDVMLSDGVLGLQRPVFELDGVDAGELAPSIRVARAIPGVGLLEAIPEADILARADEADCDQDGISGRAQLVPDPADPGVQRLGRFGWKAEKISVAHQVADALDADLGVTSPLLPDELGQSELSQDDFDALVRYAQLLGLPARRNADDPEVSEGEALFHQIGCVRCHASDATTGQDHPLVELRGQRIHPYSDLLLHDMGPDLADGSGSAQASEWRTPPLWGLGLLQTVSDHERLLHDGRANGPLEAVLWHGGEAAFARAAVMALGAEQRRALVAFLESL